MHDNKQFNDLYAFVQVVKVADELASGKLVEVFEKQRITYPPMGLYYPVNRHKTQAAQALIESLRV